MNRVFFVAIAMMVSVCGFAQEAAEESKGDSVYVNGKELAVTEEGQKIAIWDFKVAEETGDVSFIISMEKAAAGELWSWCRMWLAENVKEYNKLKQIEDKEEGRLIVNYTVQMNMRANDGKYDSRWLGSQTWKMNIQCKDERFRVRMTDYTSKWNAQPFLMGQWATPLQQVNESMSVAAKRMGVEIFAKQYRNVIDEVIASLSAYLKKMTAEEEEF